MPSLRQPHPQELPRLRSFLPAPAGARYLVATAHLAPSPERIVAAAVWWSAEMPSSSEEFAGAAFCRWHVAPRWETEPQELPAALLQALVADATAAGIRKLYTTDMLPETSPFTALLSAGGWTVVDQNDLFEGQSITTWHRVNRLYQRLAAVPDAPIHRLRSVVPTPDLQPEIHALIRRVNLVTGNDLILRFARFDRPGGWSRFGSNVLLTIGPNPRLAAAMLVRVDAKVATIDAQVVDRDVCAEAGIGVGTANALLMYSTMVSLRRSGADALLRYYAHGRFHRQTVNFARQCDLARVGTSCAWQIAVSRQVT